MNNKFELDLYTMLYNGFKSNSSESLESLPVNSNERIGNSEDERKTYLIEYLRRKNIETTFVPIMKAVILLVRKNLILKVPCLEKTTSQVSLCERIKSQLNTVLHKFQPDLPGDSKNDLIANVGKYSLEDLEQQSMDGIKRFCEAGGIEVTDAVYPRGCEPLYYVPDFTVQLNYKEFIDFMSTSDVFLNPWASHYMDRLHLIACFLYNGTYRIKFLDGNHSLREIYLSIIERLTQESSHDSAIAAEQFYTRLLMMNRE